LSVDGTVRTVLWNSATIFDQEKGEVLSTIAQGLDITERKLAEEALQESEERFRAIAETSPVQIAVVRASDNKIVFTNPSFDDAFGYARGELNGQFAPDMYVDFNDRDELLRAVKKQGHVRDFEVKVKRRDGTSFWVVTSVALIHYDGNEALLGASIDITERKRNEEALRKERRLLETVVNFMPAAVCLIRGDDLTLMMANPNYQQITPGKGMLGRTLNDIWPETEVDLNSLCRKVLSSGESLHFEDAPYSIRRTPDGPLEKAYFTFSLDRVHLPGEEGWGILNTAWETTRRMEIENAIEEERDVLTFLINSIDDEVWFANVDGVFTLENPSAQTRFGLSQDAVDFDVKGMASSLEVLRPDGTSRPIEETPPLLALKGQKLKDVEEIIRIPGTGELRYRQVTASPVRDTTGTIIGSVSVVRDITERKMAEEALIKANEQINLDRKRLEYILNTMPPAVALVNASDLKFTYLNKRAMELYGFDYVGFDLDSHNATVKPLRPDGTPFSLDELPMVHSLTKGLEVRNEEMIIERPDGKRLLVLVNSAPLFDANGKVTSAILIFEDITDRKGVEGDLKRSNAELEQFAYVASHDLKEPLRMISGFLGLLEQRYKEKLDDDAIEYIEFAVDGAKRMNWLIEDLLQFSRIGRTPWNPEAVSMNEAFEQAVGYLAAPIKDSGAIVTKDELPTLVVDRMQMTTLMQNLIGNAVKFHSDQLPRVHVSAMKEGSNWVFSVRDNGIGFPMEYSDRVFLMFERLHSKDKYPGTGIGLAICKKIVERHGGRIWADSSEGKGSTFYFSLPEKLVSRELGARA
ncbi:MAG TPA: PAS domain S-box protein, partial [Methanomassiliicoccales archaeon]|nr:PAS domain S-box protein [Methanomassiliicoccales archaeon]